MHAPDHTSANAHACSLARVDAEAAAGLRILVVDDNEDMAQMMAEVLKDAGHTVRVANDGLSAIEVAISECPDVVLLDLGLPRLNGFEVAQRLRAESSLHGVKLIALSGYGQEAERRRTHEIGFNHHLVKPVDPSALLALLDRYRQTDAIQQK